MTRVIEQMALRRCKFRRADDGDHRLAVASAAAGSFTRGDPTRHRVVIGKDTRLSGYMWSRPNRWIYFHGYGCCLCWVLVCPAIAMLTRSLRADLGVMISASHNPFEDNGIAFWSRWL